MESCSARPVSTLKSNSLVAPIVESDAIEQAAVSAMTTLATLQSAADVMAAFTQKSGGFEVMFSRRPCLANLRLMWISLTGRI